MPSNIVQFPGTHYTTGTTSSNQLVGPMSKTVYPIKDIKQIRAMHRYLLSKAQTAATPTQTKIAFRNWLFFALGINMGYRGGDITELTWDKLVDYDAATDTYSIRRGDCYNYIVAEKTNKAHLVIINREAENHIDFYLRNMYPFGIRPYPNTPVFPSRKKSGTSEATVTGHVDCDAMGRILREAAKAVGITQRICTHSLRKTFGYLMYKETGDLVTLQKLFGHSSPAITLRYIGIDAEELISSCDQKPDTSIDDLESFSVAPVKAIAPAPAAVQIALDDAPVTQHNDFRLFANLA